MPQTDMAGGVDKLPRPPRRRTEKRNQLQGGPVWVDAPASRLVHVTPTLSGRKRRGEEAASHGTEECSALHYSITWSARASREGGIVRPRAFAVFRLMNSSNLVGCSTGRSAALAPLRILST